MLQPKVFRMAMAWAKWCLCHGQKHKWVHFQNSAPEGMLTHIAMQQAMSLYMPPTASSLKLRNYVRWFWPLGVMQAQNSNNWWTLKLINLEGTNECKKILQGANLIHYTIRFSGSVEFSFSAPSSNGYKWKGQIIRTTCLHKSTHINEDGTENCGTLNS